MASSAFYLPLQTKICRDFQQVCVSVETDVQRVALGFLHTLSHVSLTHISVFRDHKPQGPPLQTPIADLSFQPKK